MLDPGQCFHGYQSGSIRALQAGKPILIPFQVFSCIKSASFISCKMADAEAHREDEAYRMLGGSQTDEDDLDIAQLR